MTTEKQITPRKRNFAFDLRDQKRLLLLAESEGYNAARVCREYNIPKGTLAGWKKKIDLSLDYAKGQFTMHTGPKSIGKHLEPIVISFVDSRHETLSECTVDSIAFEIIQFDSEFLQGDFSRIKKWVYRFLDRNDYAIRNKTHVAQKECDLEYCLDTVLYCNEIREVFQVHPDFVINMDETPCYFDNRPKTKVVSKGMKYLKRGEDGERVKNKNR